MLRIGLLCHANFGGSGVVASELAIALASRGHQVHVFATAVPPRLKSSPAVHSLYVHTCAAPPSPLFEAPLNDLALVSHILSVHTETKLDLLHSHYALPHAASAVLASLAAEDQGKPLALATTLHGTDVTDAGASPALLPTMRFVLSRSHAISCVSKDLATKAKKAFFENKTPPFATIQVIPNFVDVERFNPQARRKPGPPRIVHVSNLRPIKRVPWLIEAFALATQPKSGAETCELWIVGNGPDKALCLKTVERLGIAHRVRLLGERLDVSSVLLGAAGFALASTYESFGLAALEAMVSGVPVVACNVGGLPELLGHAKCGFLVDAHDLEGFASRLRVLCADHKLAHSMGRAAHQRATQTFTKHVLVERYEQLYESALSKMHLSKVGGDRWKPSESI